MFPWCEKSTEARVHVLRYHILETVKPLVMPICEAMLPVAEWMERTGLIRKDVKRKTLTSMLWFKVILVGVWIHLLIMVGGCFAMGIISVWGFVVYEVISNIFIWSSLYLFYLEPRKGGEKC